MKMHQVRKLFLTFGLAIIYSSAWSDVSNPCTNIFAIADRPGQADSPCTVPNGQADIEGGYQYLNQTGGVSGQNFPQPFFRIGLPLNNEFVAVLPNYNLQAIFPHSGWSAATVGIKHEIAYTNNWMATVEGLVTLPTGSAAFGSADTGGALNAIASYNFTS